MTRRLLCVLLAVCAAVVAAGCGATGTSRPGGKAKLLLDFTPNAVHAGLYLAAARDYASADGVELDVLVPAHPADGVKLLTDHRTDFAILDVHDLALARERGRDLVGVMAIVQRPLASLVAARSIRSPRDLEGRRAGVTGRPSDDAILRSIVRRAGGDPAKVRRTTVGFGAVRALVTGRVAAATTFSTTGGAVVRAKRPGTRVFRVDALGAPRYPELVLTVTRDTLDDRASLVDAVVAALQRGYREALLDPESAITALTDEVPDLDRGQVRRQLDALGPSFQAADGTVGTLDLARLRAWATWEQRFGITRRKPDVFQTFDPAPARAGAKQAAQSRG
jgi:putative hydroxymethylpyrimidine transport system substrate-binding protein